MRFFYFVIVLLLVGCTAKKGQETSGGAGLVDTIDINDEGIKVVNDSDEETDFHEGLNGIRFENFKEKDWVDNEYIKTLRKHLDDYNAGRIEDKRLDEYKDKIRGKFIVFFSTPFLGGGLYLQVVFIDNPKYLFTTWIYSDVDVEKRKVWSYHLQDIHLEEERMDFTKEQILEDLKTRPELKLW